MESELFLVGSLPRGNINNGSTGTSSKGTVITSICPTGKLVAMVTSSYEAQFITGEAGEAGSDGLPSFIYNNSYQGLLDIAREAMSTKPRPQATAVLVIPIAFNTQSGDLQSSSVVLVGFSDGFIRGYSKSGQRVISQLMHTEPVKRITCMTSPPIGSSSSSLSNLVVSYPDHVCVAEGDSLVNMIKTYVQNKAADTEEEAVLSYKKWRILDQTSTHDIALLGHSTPSLFDHLCEASTVGGFDTTLRSTPSPEACLITVGESPMIALYKITKDAGHLNMSEVVSAVASKMRSAVLGKISQASGWLGWGKSSSSSPKPAAKKESVHLSTNLPMSTNIPDGRRSVASIVVSPQGNLAAAVDSFGRVLLLETESLTIRRMWKGYRDAQCAWMLVSDTAPTVRSERGRRKRPHTPSPSGKKAQCLCIYAPRRGILELWPVVSGSRVGVFQVGENCQLLYSPHGTFTFNLSDNKVGASGKGIHHTPVLLCPDGSLITVTIPFPMLTRLGDPTSFDAHLMKKLPQAIKTGDWTGVATVISSLKSSQSMKQAVDLLLGAHQSESLSYDVIIKMLNVALERVDGIDPATGPLLTYLRGVWQGVELLQGVEELVTTSEIKTEKLEELLCSSCDLPRERATNITSSLNTYFLNHSLKKTVVKNFDLKSFLKCFKLPSRVGNVLLTASKSLGEESVGVARSVSSSRPVKLSLREGLAKSTLLDLGSALFKKLLSADIAEYSLATLFQSCGVPRRDLLSLLSVLFVSGAVSERSPSVLTRRLHTLLPYTTPSLTQDNSPSSSVTSKSSVPAGEEVWSEVWSQSSLSCSPGHALILILVSQKLATASSEDKIESDEQEWESWEPLSSEREHWISLSHQLELLTLVSNLIGQDSMTRLPTVPYASIKDADSAVIDPAHVELISSDTGLCADALVKYGTGLIAHCVAKWLVANQIPAEFVARIPSDPHDNSEPKMSKVVFQMSPLLKLLPLTLSHEALLLHCAWQAVTSGESPLDHLTQVGTIKNLKGAIGVLWVCLFERQVISLLSSLKRGPVTSQAPRSAVSVGRILFSWLYRISAHDRDNASQEPAALRDLVSLPRPTAIVGHLSELTAGFPEISPTVVKTYLELLLLTEVALATNQAMNLITYFPTWLRGALGKGAYKCAWQEQVPLQLQQKRTKCLCEMVKIYLSDDPVPAVPPTLTCRALEPLPPSNHTEVATHKDIVLLLATLWGVEGDAIRRQWVCAFFAAGLGDKGAEVFQDIRDKTRASQELLTFSGQLSDVLLTSIDNQTRQLALMAQLSPSLLEYLRNQGKRPLPSVCTRVTPTWSGLSQLCVLIQPYLATRSSQNSILAALAQLAEKCVT